MRRILLFIPIVFALVTSVNAQISNASFENWEIDTTEFAGFGATIPPDTFDFSDPVGWTSSNAVTGADSLGGQFFVEQSSDAQVGVSSIRCVTGEISLPIIPSFPINIVLPGFALNGDFNINPAGLLLNGTISPIIVPGAGEPVAGRLGKIGAWVKYTPAFNPNTNAADTLLVWATLKKGDVAVADAIIKTNDTLLNFTNLEADFVYHSCLVPDTLIVMVASSIPSFGSLLSGGNSGLVPGSVLLVDSIYTGPLAGNFAFPPIANNDVDTTFKNQAKNLDVLTNDEDCNGDAMTVAIAVAPLHGTAVAQANGEITYTPNTDFLGWDSLYYSITDGTGSGTGVGKSKILVRSGVGIREANLAKLAVYPNPATNNLTINMDLTGEHTISVFNTIGSLVETVIITGGTANLNLEGYANGAYYIKVTDASNTLVATSKFSVNK